MPTFDLHYHANIHKMPERGKRLRLQKIRWHMQHGGIDYVASTEHSYKNPLEAYLRLAEVMEGCDTEIIPGVEAVSSEGIDIIYLFRSEAALRQALPNCRTFRWSVRDVKRIAMDNDAVSIVPHPFHIGNTSAGNILSRRAYQRLLTRADYVEIHNGSAVNVDRRITTSRTCCLFKKTQAKLGRTLNLPQADRGQGLGWAVSSDAHYPGEQYVVGLTDMFPQAGEDTLDFLARRVRFRAHMLTAPVVSGNAMNYRLLRSFQGILKEGLTKKYLLAMGRTQAMAAFGLYYGLFPAF